MRGVLTFGVCIPSLRLPRTVVSKAMAWVNPQLNRQRGERTVCNWDEDTLTMGVEAARGALRGIARQSISNVVLASTTLPFADRSNATVVAGALGLSPTVSTQDATGSQRAGTSSLAQAMLFESSKSTLVIGADRRLAKPGSEQEMTYGHAAAALVVGEGTVIARYVGGSHHAADFVDHHRLTDASFDYNLEERWVSEEGWQKQVPIAIVDLLREQSWSPTDVAHLLVNVASSVGKKLAALSGIPADRLADNLHDRVGDTGTGHPLLMLAAILENANAGERIVLVGFGQGVDVLLFEVTSAIEAWRRSKPVTTALQERLEEPSYTRFLAHCGLLAPEFGMRSERDNRTAQTVAWRRHDELLTLTGGRCVRCGTIQFPLSGACVEPSCRHLGRQDPIALNEQHGRIKTFTEDWLAYSQRPPLVYGNVAFESGGNAFIEFTDFAPNEAAVGQEVRFVFRLKDVDRLRGFRRYFWKAAPVVGFRNGSH